MQISQPLEDGTNITPIFKKDDELVKQNYRPATGITLSE